MFVLPPPPRYPTQQALTAAAASGQALPIIETNNVLGHPVGPEFQLLAGEGTYILKDDLHLATPPPHPSEALPINPNPLATIMGPPGIGTRLSIISIIGKPPNTQVSKAESTSGTWPIAKKPHSIKESSREGRSSSESHSARLSSEVGTAHSNGQSQGLDESVPVFGDANALLAPATSSKETLKRRKPKNNIVKSNSSFVSRVIPHEAFTKRVQERSPEGTMAFANVNRAFQWIDLSSPTMADALTKILFTKAHALCHDVNQLTKSSTHLDVIMGFSTGDIIWYEPMSQKYARLNKNVVINSHPVSEIRWIPGSENLFLAAHMDGSLVVYDKEKEDAIFMPEDIEVPSNHSSTSEDTEPVLHVKKSVNSRNQRSNPVSYWKISNQRINGFSFSPDGKHLAVVSEDGSLRIIDYLKERLIDVYTSYYGGFMCVSWSPDGKYTITGGQDDLVSIWSLAESRIVARCQGHHSWVTAVAFDPWRCDERNYRFGSVGEDRRLLLWDFSVGMLHRPKAASVRHRGSVSSHAGLPNRPRTESSVTTASRSSAHHPVEPRARTAMLPPVLSKAADPDPLSWLGFEEDCIITACCNGHIRKWDRPKEGQDAGEPVLEVSSSAF